MSSDDEIVNRVSQSSLITIDPEDYFPKVEIVEIDLKDILFQGQILREKDLRDFIKSHNWSIYKDKNVAIHCSEEAIIPIWAYLLLSIAVEPFAKKIFYGNRELLIKQLFIEAIEKEDWGRYTDTKVVIKGCGKIPIPTEIYVDIVTRLTPIANSVMFGEACSTIPLYKRKQ